MDDKKGKIIFIHHCFTSLVSTPRRSIDRFRRFPFLSTHYRIESNATDASQHICAYVYLNRSNFYFFGNFSSPSRNANDGMEFRYKINGAYTTRYFVKKKEKKGREIREIFQRIARSKNVGRRRSLFTREANIVDRRLSRFFYSFARNGKIALTIRFARFRAQKYGRGRLLDGN